MQSEFSIQNQNEVKYFIHFTSTIWSVYCWKSGVDSSTCLIRFTILFVIVAGSSEVTPECALLFVRTYKKKMKLFSWENSFLNKPNVWRRFQICRFSGSGRVHIYRYIVTDTTALYTVIIIICVYVSHCRWLLRMFAMNQ